MGQGSQVEGSNGSGSGSGFTGAGLQCPSLCNPQHKCQRNRPPLGPYPGWAGLTCAAGLPPPPLGPYPRWAGLTCVVDLQLLRESCVPEVDQHAQGEGVGVGGVRLAIVFQYLVVRPTFFLV